MPREACLGYDHSLLESFQRAAGFAGDDVDGFYGPASRDALIRFGVRNPPPPLYGAETVSKSPGSRVGLILGAVATGLGVWWLWARRRS